MFPQIETYSDLTETQIEEICDHFDLDNITQLTVADINEYLKNETIILKLWEEQAAWEASQHCPEYD